MFRGEGIGLGVRREGIGIAVMGEGIGLGGEGIRDRVT
jgi:hypothetical protein